MVVANQVLHENTKVRGPGVKASGEGGEMRRLINILDPITRVATVQAKKNVVTIPFLVS